MMGKVVSATPSALRPLRSRRPDLACVKSRKVVPPTGVYRRGEYRSQSVKTSCDDCGRSRILMGRVIHSFHLVDARQLRSGSRSVSTDGR